MSGIVPLNLQEFANQIRHWVHYDTLISTLNKQAAAARQMRDRYEREVLRLLSLAKTEDAVIQIAGGRITVGEERHAQPLSFKTLEEMLHEYYTQKPGAGIDETANIIKFIKGHRAIQTSKRLKRQIVAPTLPPTPAGGALPGSGPAV